MRNAMRINIKIPQKIVFVLLFFSCSTGQLATKERAEKCQDVRCGKFVSEGNKKGNTFYIERIDSLQIETNGQNDAKIISKIDWIDDCKYMLTALKSTVPIVSLSHRRFIVEIDSIKNDVQYFRIYPVELKEKEQHYTMRKIE